MAITLKWRDATSLSVDAENLNPDRLLALSAAEVAHLWLPTGNTSAEVGELFAVNGETSDGQLRLEGDLRHVRRIGHGMASGAITIRGDVGGLLGAEMSGGLIEVKGNVGDWAGAEMRGGRLVVHGCVGDALGAAMPGSRLGMREGVILVVGDAGDDIGLGMRRGLIAVSGRTGDGLGRSLIAGSIFAFGPAGRRAGAGMKRGTLVFLGPSSQPGFAVLPTFVSAGRYRPPFLTIYLRQLRAWGVPVPESAFSAVLERYNGDLVEQGQGEVWVAG